MSSPVPSPDCPHLGDIEIHSVGIPDILILEFIGSYAISVKGEK